MRIPSDAFVPYLVEVTDRPLPANSRAEPVGDAAPAGGALSQAPRDQQATSYEAQEAAPALKKSPQNRRATEQERRREERRKEQRFVLLDTRVANSRRRASRYASINLKV